MKRMILAAFAALSLASCSPQAYVMYLQTRQPSDSGVDMDGKTMSIVYLENGTGRDSLYNNCVADGLASGLEKEYFNSEAAVDLFSIVTKDDYSSKDSLARLLLDMDVDIVFLLDRPEFADNVSASGKTKVTSHLYVYDSMDRKDRVCDLNASCNLTSVDVNDAVFAKEAQKVGAAFSKKFINTWTDESFCLLYYDGTKWTNALVYANDLEWDKAADIWLGLAADSKSPVARSCAAYNLALACYMQKEYSLALEWLAQSDKLNPLSVSKDLRKRIQDKM
ncbi:MAG: DUF6340 family protein [Bacteroidales bacterium]|nr:DUF6340 family protein [Bacteroidales bacterium]